MKHESPAMKTLEEKKNPVLNRDELLVELGHEGKPTPSRREMLEALSAHIKAQKEHIIVDKVFNFPGRGMSRAKVLVYKKVEDIPKGKLEKMQGRMKAKKQGEAAAEEKKEG